MQLKSGSFSVPLKIHDLAVLVEGPKILWGRGAEKKVQAEIGALKNSLC